MKFEITSEDPFKVLSSTRPIVESLKYIEIHEENLDKVCKILSDRLKKGKILEEMNFGNTGNLKDNIQLIFLEDTVNFCFWAEKEKPKWTVEWPKGSKPADGWFALTKCFVRALAQNKPILKAEFLENISLDETRSVFLSANGKEIPLRIEAHRVDDILHALRLADEFKFTLILEKCTEGYRIAPELAKSKVPVIAGPVYLKDMVILSLSPGAMAICLGAGFIYPSGIYTPPARV